MSLLIATYVLSGQCLPAQLITSADRFIETYTISESTFFSGASDYLTFTDQKPIDTRSWSSTVALLGETHESASQVPDASAYAAVSQSSHIAYDLVNGGFRFSGTLAGHSDISGFKGNQAFGDFQSNHSEAATRSMFTIDFQLYQNTTYTSLATISASSTPGSFPVVGIAWVRLQELNESGVFRDISVISDSSTAPYGEHMPSGMLTPGLYRVNAYAGTYTGLNLTYDSALPSFELTADSVIEFDLKITPIPEPMRYGAATGGLCVLVALLRRCLKKVRPINPDGSMTAGRN